MEALRGLAGDFLNLLFPPKCLLCGALAEPFCRDCRGGIQPAEELRPPARIRAIRSAGYHEGPLRQAVLQLKFGRKVSLVPALADLLAEELAPVCGAWDPHLVAPVADHWTRRLERGYNQAELLARHLSRVSSLPFAPALRRVRPTGHQVGHTAAERAARLTDAFVVSTRVEVAGKRVLLVDDVWTTGATLAGCAEVLRAAGAGAVYALTVTHDR